MRWRPVTAGKGILWPMLALGLLAGFTVNGLGGPALISGKGCRMGGQRLLLVAGATRPGAENRRRRMKMTFVRSGGFAGRATNVEGTITFEGGGGEVVSGDGYKRVLGEAECSELKAALEAGTRESGAKEMPDAFQYEVTVVMPDGHRRSANVEGMDARVGAWVRAEADRIWNHRVESRK